jgi:glycosyltransferase involved in cell wall biosynthesis
MDLSVVIGTCNQAPTLRYVLRSFADQTYPADRFEVVVIDSESTDDTAAVCEAGDCPFALVYVRKKNEGKCSARNVGLATARSGAVLLTDADVLADPTLVAAHVAALAEFPGVVVVGQQYMVDWPDHNRLQASGFRLQACHELQPIGSRSTVARGPEPGARSPMAAGHPCLNPRWSRGRSLSWRQFVTGNASLSRETLLEVGGFDEGFRGYGFEDYELGYRLAGRGVRFVFEPTAINYHFHPVAFESDLVRKREAGRAAVYFASRHPSRALRVHLGLTPLNRALYGRIAVFRWLERTCRALQGRQSPAGRIARHMLLEIEYQHGAREAWRDKNRPC